MSNEPEPPSEDSHAHSSGASQWRWPIVILTIATMALVAYIYSVKTAKEVAENTARKTQETLRDIGESAITIAENFQQSKITHTFTESLPEAKDAGEGRLEVGTLENTKVFKRTNKRTILWDKISLGTTVTEIRVPATFRYHLKLSDPWKLEVRNQQCFVIAPMMLPTTPVAIHTDKIEKRSERGWARFNKDEQMDSLMRTITPRLTSQASSDSHINLVREHARKTVAEFVRQWLMKEDHWREDRFQTITVIFADEAAAEDFPAKPTLQLN